MNETKTQDDIMPGAVPTEDEIRRWRNLPANEQTRRLQQVLEDGFSSGTSERSIDEIIAAARKFG